jgi:hypothetical protein
MMYVYFVFVFSFFLKKNYLRFIQVRTRHMSLLTYQHLHNCQITQTLAHHTPTSFTDFGGFDNYVSADISEGTCVVFLVVLNGSEVVGR